MTPLQKNIDHSRIAYLYAIRSLPDPDSLGENGITLHGITFTGESQVNSMTIELGWSFFCRYEGCLEAYLKSKSIKLSKKCSIENWLENAGIAIPDDLKPGLQEYRKIRNSLHHDDGSSLNESSDTEIHLLPPHMENFYRLFVWISEQIETKC